LGFYWKLGTVEAWTKVISAYIVGGKVDDEVIPEVLSQLSLDQV
jgi:hypothetical protein